MGQDAIERESERQRLAEWDRIMGSVPEKLCFVCGRKHWEHGTECSACRSVERLWR